METIKLGIIITGILILITIITGIWLSKLGRPLNTVIFAVHKIVPIFTIIYMAIIVFRLQKNIEAGNKELILIIITGLIFLFAFVSGALLSFEKPVNFILLVIHKIMSFLIVISSVLTFYILLNKK